MTAPMMTYFGRQFSIKGLRDFLIDSDLNNTDTLILNQVDFDDLALDYRLAYGKSMEQPFLLLGVLIFADSTERVGKGRMMVVLDDFESPRTKEGYDKIYGVQFDPYRIVHRCGWCGNVVDRNGYELDEAERDDKIAYLSKFGDRVNVRHVDGKCCRNQCDESAPRNPNQRTASKLTFDYSAVANKTLMELTEKDFEQIGVYKSMGEALDFEVIYYCSADRGGKIYFTPNENSYIQRGHMLREEAIITTSEQLMQAVRDWRRN